MKKIILGIILGVLFSSVGTVFAQQATIGNPPTQIVKITIDEDGSAHVIHVVEPSIQPQQVTVIQNNFTNLQIKEENGYIPQYGEVSGNVKSSCCSQQTKELSSNMI
ncbi:hypothetical protein QVH35_03500 [Candidatus Nitrosotenuis chungbukensis]|uniref:hypothetical protein n=1 Tax=Candidatus Nitrosotenuis chungbukensis TaxID=1353246 RepID=UPI0026719832|nr:hypothetical protein [Candidatus Nitrosotenuis chungbukensis]WKT58472.1 hypothetical protein QVH35_03500 [Candidatus Nitrosotenuis chungbukensis]